MAGTRAYVFRGIYPLIQSSEEEGRSLETCKLLSLPWSVIQVHLLNVFCIRQVVGVLVSLGACNYSSFVSIPTCVFYK